MKPGLSPALGLSLGYGALYLVIGVQLPYWPLYLQSRGLGPAAIGQVIAIGYLARLVCNPLAGHLADKTMDRRRLMLALAAFGLVATACFPLADGFWPILALSFLAQSAFSSLMPLTDSLAISIGRIDYGRVRLWGSLSFIAAASLGGPWLVAAPRGAILLASLAALGLTLAAVGVLPNAALAEDVGRRKKEGPTVSLSNPAFVLFLAAAGLVQVSHMSYYGFATLHWRAAGLEGSTIGALWAEGVIAEVLLFAFGARLVRRFGPARLIAAGGAAGALRWTVLASTSWPPLLFAVQGLHALTFAACHLGAMHHILAVAPKGAQGKAQGLYAAFANGLAPALVMPLAGGLYGLFGARSFLAMSGLAALGGCLALCLHRNERKDGLCDDLGDGRKGRKTVKPFGVLF